VIGDHGITHTACSVQHTKIKLDFHFITIADLKF